MPITFSSNRFTVTGGKISGTATSATSNTLTATGLFTGYTTETLCDRVVWIHAGTGSGQFRNITIRNSNDQITVDEPWVVTPDATSQFLVGYDPTDLAAVSAVGCNIIGTGEVAPGGNSSGLGYFADITSFLTVGDNTTKTFIHFPKGCYQFSVEVTSTDSTYPWLANAQVILIQDNAVVQFGNHKTITDSGYSGAQIIMNQAESSWDKRFINTHTNVTSVFRAFASSFQHTGRSLNDGINRSFIALQFTGDATALIIDCSFMEGVQFRPFSSNTVYKKTKFFNCQTNLYNTNSTPSDITLIGDNPLTTSSNSDDNGSNIFMERFNVTSTSNIPDDDGASPNTSTGDVGIRGNSSCTVNAYCRDFTWNKTLAHANPPSQTFSDNGAGNSTIREQYGFTATVKDDSQTNIENAFVSLRATAGNCTVDGVQINALTASSGSITKQWVTTHFTDRDGGANQGWTSGQLPYWRQSSKYSFRTRIRRPEKLFFATPVDFSNPDNNAGRSVALNASLLDDANYTADGSLVTGVSLTDNRSSPVSWNGKNWGLTIVANLTTNPSLTVQDIYNWYKYHFAQNANVPGTSVNAGEFHEVFNGIDETVRGSYYDPNDGTHVGLGVVNDGTTELFGVRVVDENGDAFPGFSRFQADDGTYVDFGQVVVTDGATYTSDATSQFLVDTDTVTSFTIDGFTPTQIEHIGSGTTTILGVNNAKLVGTNIVATGGTLLLGDGLNPSSNYTVVGNEIRLNGTETDLLGLRGLNEVDYVLSAGKYTFTLVGETRIVIQSGGDLTIDSDVEKLVGGVTPGVNQNTVKVQSGGRLQLGRETNVSGFVSYSEGDVLSFTNDTTDTFFVFLESQSNLLIESGATLDWYGGNVVTIGAVSFMSGSTINTYSQNAKLLFVQGSSTQLGQLRQRTSGATFNGLTLETGLYVPIANPISFADFNPVTCEVAVDISSSTPDNVFLTFFDFLAGQGNVRDVAMKNNKWLRFVNTNNGSDIDFNTRSSGTGDAGLAECRKEVRLTVKDGSGSPVQDVLVYGADNDNGNRVPANTYNNNPDYVADRVYSDTTDAFGIAEFVGDTGSILFAVLQRTAPGFAADYRGATNDNSDLFLLRAVSYDRQITDINLNLKGIGVLEQDVFALLDNLITETDKATVDAYTEIETSQKFYDRAKSWLYDNYAGETSTLVSRNGTEINAGAYDVVIDATAVSPFSVAGNTITIKASTYIGDMTTTGTITLLNGATFNGTRTDTNGTVAPPTGISISNLVAGSQVVIYQTGTTTIIDSTNNSGTSFSYSVQSSVGTVDYTVLQGGYEPIRVTGVVIPDGSIVSQSVKQRDDREYDASHGLTYTTDFTVNIGTGQIVVNTPTTGRSIYSAMIDAYIARESDTANTSFPLSMDGNNSLSIEGLEFTSTTNLSRTGFRYVASGVTTATYSAVQTPTLPAGSKVWVEQQDGGSWSLLNTGTGFDGMVQVFGDATHGNFDYTSFMALKATGDGYTVAEWDVINDGGISILEDSFYFAPLSITLTGETLGDPGALDIVVNNIPDTIWNGITVGQEVVVNDSLTGSQVMRYLTWQRHQGNLLSFGKLVEPLGGDYKSSRGRVYDGTPLEIEGTRVVLSSDGVTPHPDFILFEGAVGETYTPPLIVTGSVTITQAGSRIQVYNVTTATEIANEIVAGTSWQLSQTEGSSTYWSAGDTIRIRATYQNGLVGTAKANTTVVVGSSENWNSTINQTICVVYDAYGIDGSTVTEFSWDGSNVQFDVNDPDNIWYVSRLFAWDKYLTFTETGIRDAFDYIGAVDAGNIRIDNSAALDNLKAQTATQGDNIRLFRPNGTLPVATPTTGGGGFSFYSTGNIYIAETGTSGLTASEAADLAQTKAKVEAIEKLAKLIPAAL